MKTTPKKKCVHQFFELKKTVRYVQGSPSLRMEKEGVQVVCVLCGERREAWDSGEVDVKESKRADEKDITTGDPEGCQLGRG
jgi:hypothetical protein